MHLELDGEMKCLSAWQGEGTECLIQGKPIEERRKGPPQIMYAIVLKCFNSLETFQE